MKRLRGGLLHLCAVCSLVGITAAILDWYNPYMNFGGNTMAVQMVLYFAVLILELSRSYAGRKKNRRFVIT